VHTTGYRPDGTTGTMFFTGAPSPDITARSIKLAVSEPGDVAASGTTVLSEATNTMVGSRDGSVADKLGDFGVSGTGADKAYQNMIAELGVTSQMVGRRAEIQLNVTEQVDASRDAESGVNLDEEMTNMIKYQRGYEAASRVLTSIDEMLDVLINRTGLVGR
jgi:flagellar hook-associated protein 1 FlgK